MFVDGGQKELKAVPTNLEMKFTYRHKDLHYSKQKLIEVIPCQKVVWHVLESDLSFTVAKSEWTGTKIIFDIAKKWNETEIRLTHLGLVPDCECFDACSGGWGSYVNGSLRSLITTGKGHPDLKEKEDAEKASP
jgi:hypothetical protein